MSTYVYVDPNRAAYGSALPTGYDNRSARKPVQRRVVDFTSPVARHLQLRLAQGDGWNDQMLTPALGSALDVRLAGGWEPRECAPLALTRLAPAPASCRLPQHASHQLRHQVRAREHQQGARPGHP